MIPFPQRLEGKKVWLRPFGPADITEVYIGWLKDLVVTRFSNQRFRHHTRESCAAYLASFAGSHNHFVSVRSLADDEPLGTMTAYVTPEHGTVDVGIMIGAASAWGQGIGQDAWDTMLGWLLARPDIRKVTAGTLAVNKGMIRLAERSGMALEGRRIGQELVEGEAVDILYFGRFADRPD